MIQKKYHLGARFFTSQKTLTHERKTFPGVDILLFSSDNNYSRYACVLKKNLFSSHVSKNRYKRSFFSLIQEKEFHKKITEKDIIVIIKKPTEEVLETVDSFLNTLL